MDKTEFLAHIDENGNHQTMEEHLIGTSKYAEKFGDSFGCGEIASIVGLYHDIGKYSSEFQRRIRNPLSISHVDHSTAGAKEIMNESQNYLPLAMAIAGHHSGLMDGGNKITTEPGTFLGRMKSTIPDYTVWKESQRQQISFKDITMPSFVMKSGFSVSFFTRMIYSCLVDADYLDTETFMTGGKSQRENYASKEELLKRFQAYVEEKNWLDGSFKHVGRNINRNVIGKNRSLILKECLENGRRFQRGIYTLTVPTGGGKTTASLGFALNHIVTNSMERIIYVIPYTSVIDQNAGVFSEILGSKNIVEHHSGMVYEKEEGKEKGEEYRKALATENWDAPVIVTTAVQFFESLFANKSSKCRKLHNLANSVIIFDEAQTLPIPYLEPCVAAISQLVENYRATAVLCTATQPALDAFFKTYLPTMPTREICSGREELFTIFQRTKIINIGNFSKNDLIKQLNEKEQVLCILNRRGLVQDVYKELCGEGTYCLTTLLCPKHRKDKLEEIKYRLMDSKYCKVISTSLIEAGVDLDFPCVYRQEAALDSLLQSAGRCNREGKRKAEESQVFSFCLDGQNDKAFQQAIAALNETWYRYDTINTPEAISFYFNFFRDLLGQENLDQKEIMKAWRQGIAGNNLPFETISKEFNLIENNMTTIYIPLEGSEALLAQVQYGQAGRNTFRKLGQYGVNVHRVHFDKLWEAGCVEELSKGIFVLRDMNQYSNDIGLQMDVETGVGILI